MSDNDTSDDILSSLSIIVLENTHEIMKLKEHLGHVDYLPAKNRFERIESEMRFINESLLQNRRIVDNHDSQIDYIKHRQKDYDKLSQEVEQLRKDYSELRASVSRFMDATFMLIGSINGTRDTDVDG